MSFSLPFLDAAARPAAPALHLPSVPEMSAAIRAWLDLHLVEVGISVVAGTLIYLAMRVARRQLRRLRDRPGEEMGFGTLIGRTFARTTHFFMLLAAARLVVGYANPPDWLFSTIRFLFTVAAVFQGAIWLRELILGIIERRTSEDGHGETLSNAMGIIRILVSVALFAIAAIVVLDNLGVNVTGLVAGLGIGGIAIGLAAQGIFSDLFAALAIIFDKPFRQGETIKYDQTTATVERIGLKTTRLRALTGEKKIIGNTQLLQKEISSFQHLDHRRFTLAIRIANHTPADLAERMPELLGEAVESRNARLVRAGFVAFQPTSLDYECVFDVQESDMSAAARVSNDVGMAIYRSLEDQGIDLI